MKAFDETLQRLVAIKMLTAQAADDDRPRQRFLREARAAAAIRDEHVVTVFEVEEEPVPYLAMEYVRGDSLQDRINRAGILGVQEIVRIGAEVAQGLAAAHRQGLIHRDIKPANLLVRHEDSMVKIADFGLAKAADDVALTRTGIVAGTPLFMSPEQAQGQTLDHRTDLFSLGSVLYTLGAGQPPFLAARMLAVIKRVREDTPRPIREVNPAIPDRLAAFIDKLLAKGPDQRIQTAAEVADWLGRYLVYLRDPSVPMPDAPVSSTETVDFRPVGEATAEFVPAARTAPWPTRRWLAGGGFAVVSLGIGLLAGAILRPGLTNRERPNEHGQEQARILLERTLSEQPDNEAVAGALAELMLAEPTASSEGGPPSNSAREAFRNEARQAGLRGFAALGAACFARDDFVGASEVLTRALKTSANPSTGELLLLAVAESERNRIAPARRLYDKAIKGISQRPLDRLATLLARRAMQQIEGLSVESADTRLRTWSEAREVAALTSAIESHPTGAQEYEARALWYARRGRWKDAARDHLAQLDLSFGDAYHRLSAAATILLAGDRTGYQQLCDRFIQSMEPSLSAWQSDVICRVWLLLPGSGNQSKVPLQRLKQAVLNNEGDGELRLWLAVTQALADYRADDYAQAVVHSSKFYDGMVPATGLTRPTGRRRRRRRTHSSFGQWPNTGENAQRRRDGITPRPRR